MPSIQTILERNIAVKERELADLQLKIELAHVRIAGYRDALEMLDEDESPEVLWDSLLQGGP